MSAPPLEAGIIHDSNRLVVSKLLIAKLLGALGTVARVETSPVRYSLEPITFTAATLIR
jgi:hypothetical protein